MCILMRVLMREFVCEIMHMFMRIIICMIMRIKSAFYDKMNNLLHFMMKEREARNMMKKFITISLSRLLILGVLGFTGFYMLRLFSWVQSVILN